MTSGAPKPIGKPKSQSKKRSIELKTKIALLDSFKITKILAKSQRDQKLQHLDYTTLLRWTKQEAKIREALVSYNRQKPANKFRVSGAGRKPALQDHEIEVFFEIKDLREKKIRVTRKMVYKIAIDISEKYGIVGFKGTSKWMRGFFWRFKLSLRRQSSLQTLSDEEIVERCVSLLHYLQEMVVNEHTIEMENIICMDETAVHFTSSQTTTVDFTNASSVVVRGTGFDSDQITCILAIKPTGELLKPMLILKGKETGEIMDINGIWVAYSEKAWVTESIILKWTKLAFAKKSEFFNPRRKSQKKDPYDKMLVWDACPVHRAEKVKKHLKINVILFYLENIECHDIL